MYWVDEPATEQQLIHLRNAGYVVDGPLTKIEAARLIRECHRNPGRQTAPFTPSKPSAVPSPRTQALEPMSQTAEADLSESTKMHAYRLRMAAENARRALATDPGAPNVRADLVSTTTSRREFWMDTCREVKEMHIASMQVFELYQRYGCRFSAPTHEQAQTILDALDKATPVWDRDHPELFYQTLELNFPQLVRQGCPLSSHSTL